MFSNRTFTSGILITANQADAIQVNVANSGKRAVKHVKIDIVAWTGLKAAKLPVSSTVGGAFGASGSLAAVGPLCAAIFTAELKRTPLVEVRVNYFGRPNALSATVFVLKGGEIIPGLTVLPNDFKQIKR